MASDADPEAVGPDLLASLERTFGVGVIVQAIDDGPPVSIQALVMYGSQSQTIAATGTTEDEAWRDLASRIVEWRTGDDKYVPLWWGGGAV